LYQSQPCSGGFFFGDRIVIAKTAAIEQREKDVGNGQHFHHFGFSEKAWIQSNKSEYRKRIHRFDKRTTGILRWLTKWYRVPTARPVNSETSRIVSRRSLIVVSEGMVDIPSASVLLAQNCQNYKT
jgi:hypothetical protein